MAADVIKVIKNLEVEVEKKALSAKESAEALILNAKKDAIKIVEDAKTKAKELYNAEIAKTKQEVDKETRSYKNSTGMDINKLRDRVRAKESEAIDFIINNLK